MRYFFTIITFFWVYSLLGQDGVFVDASTYLNNTPTAAEAHTRWTERVNSLKLHSYKGTQVFDAHNAYGFRHANKDWRFYQQNVYEIVSNKDIYVYRLIVEAQTTSELYFFSKTVSSELIPLSRRNLRRAYQDNKAFLAMLDILHWRFHLEDPIPPYNHIRVAELFSYSQQLQPNLYYR